MFPPSRHSPPATRHSQRGVALIITLILLSVVTFMAITFLALSRRERSAVSTVTDTASARLAADAALAYAEGQIMANALSTTNPFNFGLLVSTNYINTNGFVSGVSSFNNVNYQYANGNSLNQNDFLQNLTNLWYSPRPPVFIPTNSAGANDFRFYLDLNRNGQFEDTRQDAPNVNNLGVTNGHNSRSRRSPVDRCFAAARRAVWAEQPIRGALRLHRRARRQHTRLERHS